jgi:hypothetical protein
MVNIGHYINGSLHEGKSGQSKPVFNPQQGVLKIMLAWQVPKK